MTYEWYVDIFFLTSFLMDLTGILTAAICCSVPVRIGKMLLICAVSVFLSIVLLICIPSYLIFRLVIYLVVHPLAAALIFSPKGWGTYLRLLLTVYLVFFVVGGVQESVRIQTGGDSDALLICSGIFAAASFLIYMQRQKTMQYVCSVDLWMDGKKVTILAYADSGNLLRNPFNGKPVSILEQDIMKQWDTKELEVKKIPYRTISEEQSFLDVVTLDRMDIHSKGTLKQIKAPEIGLRPGRMMKRPPVQMLLHSSYMSR